MVIVNGMVADEELIEGHVDLREEEWAEFEGESW
jgi:hypothetical protein